MLQFILIIHVLLAVSVIALVLMQHGKGADIGASFGSGASQTVFGSQGATSFLMKLTGLLAALFFTTSIALTYMVGQQAKGQEILMPKPMQSVPASLGGQAPEKSKNNK